jgi:hypothetical protein
MLLQHCAVVGAARIDSTVMHVCSHPRTAVTARCALADTGTMNSMQPEDVCARPYFMTLSPAVGADCKCTPVGVPLRLVDSGSAIGARLPGISQGVFKQLDCHQQAEKLFGHFDAVDAGSAHLGRCKCMVHICDSDAHIYTAITHQVAVGVVW